MRASLENCPYCGWEDDTWDDTDDKESGANASTIGDYRKLYEEGKTKTPELVKYRKAFLDEWYA